MDEKRLVRAAIRKQRSARAPSLAATLRPDFGTALDTVRADRGAVSHTAQLVALATAVGARSVACFVSVRGEPDTAGFLAWAHAAGVRVMLPRSLSDGLLEWVSFTPGGFTQGAFDIPEPVGPAIPPGALASADLLLIPAAAVDINGMRLGWGRGFFDRQLAALSRNGPGTAPPVYAVVWEDEVLDSVPTEPHDVPVDGAVTEVRALHFG